MVQLHSTLALLSCLASTSINGASAQNLIASDTNTEFDPLNPRETSDCHLVDNQDEVNYIRPMEGQCQDVSGNRKLTNDQMNAIAAKYAPVLYFHPLESYSMGTVDSTFADPTLGKIFQDDDPNPVVDILDITQVPDMVANNTWIERELTDDYTDGAGYDENGQSKAEMYYNYFDAGDNTWVFNYYFYYPYGGCTEIGFTSGYEGDPEFMRFRVRPFGEHEGDWETVSVMVCASEVEATSQPLAVHYHQRSYSLLTDCTKGECHFMKDTNHPVGFVALDHHSTYPFPSESHFYGGEMDLTKWGLNGTVLVLDSAIFQDADGATRSFMPNSDNVKKIDPVANMNFLYGGHWGKSGNFENIKPEEPHCFTEGYEGTSQCPDNIIVAQVLGLFESLGSRAAAILPEPLGSAIASRSLGSFGPLYQPNYNEWIAPKNAQAREIQPYMTSDIFCAGIPNAVFAEVGDAGESQENDEQVTDPSTGETKDSDCDDSATHAALRSGASSIKSTLLWGILALQLVQV